MEVLSSHINSTDIRDVKIKLKQTEIYDRVVQLLYIHSLMQTKCNSSALAMKLRLLCVEPSICSSFYGLLQASWCFNQRHLSRKHNMTLWLTSLMTNTSKSCSAQMASTYFSRVSHGFVLIWFNISGTETRMSSKNTMASDTLAPCVAKS